MMQSARVVPSAVSALRQHRRATPVLTALALSISLTHAAMAAEAPKPAETATKEANAALMKALPFSDADPQNQTAKNLQADALEQMGYQAESGPWRNFYLTGAKELREGVMKLPVPDTASPDTVRAMTLDMLFDYFGVRLNREKAAGKHVVLNLDFTDTNQKYTLEMVNSVLNHTEGKPAKDPTASLTLMREMLNRMMLKETDLKDAIAKGDVKVSGDQQQITDMFAALDNFEFWWNIVTP